MKRQLIIILLAFTTITFSCKKQHLTNDTCDCADSQDTYVISSDTLDIPSIITPNGDGFNDKWIISHISNFSDCNVKIIKPGLINNTVFESTGYATPWDGSHNGNYSDGKYKYEITIDNEVIEGYVCVYGTGNVDIDDFNCLNNCHRADTNDPIIN